MTLKIFFLIDIKLFLNEHLIFSRYCCWRVWFVFMLLTVVVFLHSSSATNRSGGWRLQVSWCTNHNYPTPGRRGTKKQDNRKKDASCCFPESFSESVIRWSRKFSHIPKNVPRNLEREKSKESCRCDRKVCRKESTLDCIEKNSSDVWKIKCLF